MKKSAFNSTSRPVYVALSAPDALFQHAAETIKRVKTNPTAMPKRRDDLEHHISPSFQAVPESLADSALRVL